MSKRFELTNDHIKLLQKAEIRWKDGEFGAPAIDCKRPYGNSSVVYDMAEILGKKLIKTDDGEEVVSEEDGDYLRNTHRELDTVLQIILHTKSFQPGTYILEDAYSNDWKYAGDIK